MQNTHMIPNSQQDELKMHVDKTKGEVLKVLELVCPSEMSFKRALKNMHNIFDDLLEKIINK